MSWIWRSSHRCINNLLVVHLHRRAATTWEVGTHGRVRNKGSQISAGILRNDGKRRVMMAGQAAYGVEEVGNFSTSVARVTCCTDSSFVALREVCQPSRGR
eukprot:3445480-Amphidinium_carterae.1